MSRYLLFLFCPSDLTAPNKSRTRIRQSPPEVVIPSAAEGSAVRPGSPHKGLRSVSSPTESSS